MDDGDLLIKFIKRNASEIIGLLEEGGWDACDREWELDEEKDDHDCDDTGPEAWTHLRQLWQLDHELTAVIAFVKQNHQPVLFAPWLKLSEHGVWCGYVPRWYLNEHDKSVMMSEADWHRDVRDKKENKNG